MDPRQRCPRRQSPLESSRRPPPGPQGCRDGASPTMSEVESLSFQSWVDSSRWNHPQPIGGRQSPEQLLGGTVQHLCNVPAGLRGQGRGRRSELVFCTFQVHQRQSATGIELLTTLQRLFFAVGFHLDRGGAVFCIDKQDVQQAHGIDGSCLGRSYGWGHRRAWVDGLQQKRGLIARGGLSLSEIEISYE